MDDIQKALQASRNRKMNHFNSAIGNDLQKGKAAQEGETREWSGKKYKKSGGKWVEIKSDKSSKKDDSQKEENQEESPNSSENDRSKIEELHGKAKAAYKQASKEDPNGEKVLHAKAAMEGYEAQLKKIDQENKKKQDSEKEQFKKEIKEELQQENKSKKNE